ncbi:sodium:pantothenate symporter [Viridibacillus sp. FSL H8-0123]|uniref:Sodium/panthothenate symporter n=1 Tax=Viridibacillus arenosi FSL R5-213 TaxID=1227360 RepID=W4F0P0_9BACL|nr:sodium/panthothenate symporter [Viridibacillus arenosi FSL R5-213]OMC82653.1 sodium:pantothenate symporter [Viridibacillus sp. FSL H7-0596]OMC84754.1 sodium:pantothenate symporter [Viridibacillus sp. FSL H8-0123]OMC91802.1 sodium:pantothenate symporter [Viridibacillus arenosi]
MIHWQVIIPLVVFLVVIFGIGIWANRQVMQSNSFLQEYFLGGREMGGFLLAMTMMATYGSAGSFIGGPGVAYNTGLGWVLLAMAQLPAGYFVLMILGKKFAIIARKYQAITLIDFLRERYQSKIVVIVSAISIILFLFASMAAQWIGGARLIESLTGLNYSTALFIFAGAVLIYVIIGGFRAVALTDAVQGSVMVIGTVILLVATVIAGGGISNIMSDLVAENPNLVSPYGADRSLTPLYVSTFWILIGIGVIGLPQIAVRAMSYKNSKGMHTAIIIGTIALATVMFGMHLIGVLARPVLPGVEIGDKVMPLLTLKVLPPYLAGIVLAAPMAAIMSTVNALLILVSSTVVKDIYLNYIKPTASDAQIKKASFYVTTVIGIAVVLVALRPPDLLIWLNLFAFGGLESVFLWPVVFGLYWKTGNKYGAIASMIIGISSYIYIDQIMPSVLGMHTVTLPIILSLVAFVVVSLVTKDKVKTGTSII